MPQDSQHRDAMGRIPWGRWTGAVVALVGLSLSVVSASPAGAAKAVVVSTSKNPTFGTILVSGKTLYTLKPSQTSCTSQCLKIWPALVLPAGVTKAQAGPGVNAAKLGTVKRGARLQVTYAGRALYWFYKDRSAGQVTGNVSDTWGKWSVVVITPPSGGGTTTTAPGGGGGGGAGF